MKNKKIEEDIGKQVKLARIKKDKYLKDVASFLGVSANQVCKYEKGINKISVSCLYRISKFLKVSICELLPDFMNKKK